MRLFLLAAVLLSVAMSHAAPVELYFEGQQPEAPGLYDAPPGPIDPCGNTVQNLAVKVVAPSTGVTSATGLLLMLPGIDGSMDCYRPLFSYDPAWADKKDLLIGFVYYRNHAFSPPYDLGKYQVTDVLRALATVLRTYPEVDRRRLYLFGGSGGGQVALQLLQCAPHLWAEVHAHCPFTTITSGDDRLRGYELDPAPLGYNEQLVLPARQGELGDGQWQRIKAERGLRSVRENWSRMPLRPADKDQHPLVYVMHGDTDRTTDFQHFLDLKAALATREKAGFTHADLRGGARFAMGRWCMFQIYGGSHSYGTAAPPLRSRSKATNYLIPAAFTVQRDQGGNPAIDFTFPPRCGITWRVVGDLDDNLPTLHVIKN